MNAMRSGLVVLGSLAFGYLTLQLGFRPFLERAPQQQEILLRQQQQQQQSKEEASESISQE